VPRRRRPPVAVLDTNVLISYLFQSPTITVLIDSLAHDTFVPAFSPHLEQEFLQTCRKPKIARRLDSVFAVAFLADWVSFCRYVQPSRRVVACRDADDNAILECALAAGAHYIVTGDKDLLCLGQFEHVAVVTPAYFVRRVLRIPR